MGIEKNRMVAESTLLKFTGNPNVTIINDDFFAYGTDESYDFILMNYVLFYFDTDQQKEVINKAKSLLNRNGSILLCQYFSGIEPLKKLVAKKMGDYSVFKKVVMYYSDKILYANTLWNDSVDTFAAAVKWDPLLQNLTELGMHIESISPADKYFYSLFVEIKKDQTESKD